MPLAAAKVQDEDVSVAKSLLVSSGTLESLLGRAGVRVVTGHWQEAARDLDSAEAMVATLGASESRGKLEATVRYLHALVATDSVSLVRLDSAVAYFAETNDLVSLLPALLLRADVRRTRGKLAGATADLDEATGRIRSIAHNQRYAFLRAAMMEQARNRFDQLVMLHVRAGAGGAALQTLERGRVSFTGSAPAPSPDGLAAPPGQVAVEYALIGDTLLTWTIRGRDVRLQLDTLDHGGFLRMIDRVDAALESPARAASVLPDLDRLYDLLIRPVENRLGAFETPLVIVADGEVAGVPFSALRDAAKGRYLMQDHPSRVVASLADATRPLPAADGPARPVLLVADPAFDGARNPGLDRLDGARAEVDSLAAMYRGRNVRLADTAATRTAFMANAPRASLIHYAGHAVFDDARPEQSALVLVGADTAGRLTAEAVNTLQLRGVRLVVLSACSTLRSREGRSGGFSGFSGALLGAGAGGVVGSLWQVDDSLTQPFMLAFHRAYQLKGDPAAALRDAQLEMLRLHHPALSSPAVWGGFRYIGR
jgi:CHAT domain-containing protein